jgi:hypothetical protein
MREREGLGENMPLYSGDERNREREREREREIEYCGNVDGFGK